MDELHFYPTTKHILRVFMKEENFFHLELTRNFHNLVCLSVFCDATMTWFILDIEDLDVLKKQILQETYLPPNREHHI